MKEPLTKKRALELCRDMWRWLEKNATIPESEFYTGSIVAETKAQWPGFAEHGPLHCNCACCELAKCGDPEDPDVDCSKCPLLSLWPMFSDNSDPLNACPCCALGSAYDKWTDAVIEGDGAKMSECARVIAEAAEAELKKLAESEVVQ